MSATMGTFGNKNWILVFGLITLVTQSKIQKFISNLFAELSLWSLGNQGLQPTHHQFTNTLSSLELEYKGFRHSSIQTTQFIRGKLLNQSGAIEYAHSYYSQSNLLLISVVKLGTCIDGHLGIVHGGMIAALFDDLFGELSSHASINGNPGFTASIKVDYKAKMPVNSLLVISSRIVKVEGRKTFLYAEARELSQNDFVACENEDLNEGAGLFELVQKHHSVLFATSDSLYIQPRINSKSI